jgi:peptidoglycan/xylan/chitin deacetylase (PgdA/CDA1 family)
VSGVPRTRQHRGRAGVLHIADRLVRFVAREVETGGACVGVYDVYRGGPAPSIGLGRQPHAACRAVEIAGHVMQFFHTNRFSGAADFAAYAIDAFDWLHREGAHAPKMMSIGLHLRMIGRPGRIGALDRILRHITNRGDAWIARRVDIANHWLAQFP